MKKEERNIRKKVQEYRIGRNTAAIKREEEAKKRALQKRKEQQRQAEGETMPQTAPLEGEPRQSKAWAARRIDPAVREKALQMMRDGFGPRVVSEKLGVPYSTVTSWRMSSGEFAIQRRKKKGEGWEPIAQPEPVPKDRPPVPPTSTDKLSRFCYLIDYVNWARKKEGLSSIGYGELQVHFDRYKKWLPKNWREMLK